MVYLKDQKWVFRDKYAATVTASTAWTDKMFSAGDVSLYGQTNALALVITVHGDARFTQTDETYAFDLQMADDAAGANAVSVVKTTIANAQAALLKAGSVIALPIPNTFKFFKRYWRLVYTATGGYPTGTAVNFSASLDLVTNVAHYVQHTSQVAP